MTVVVLGTYSNAQKRFFQTILGLCAVAFGACSYNVGVTEMPSTPSVSYANPVGKGNSPCKLNFNPAFVPKSAVNDVEGIFLRVAECPESYGGSNDHVMFAPCDLQTGECGDLVEGFQFPDGTEDPRVVFFEGTYYNFMYEPGTSANCTSSECTVALYTTSSNPRNISNWKQVGRYPWHRNGCLLPRSKPPHYLLFGEGPIGMASTSDLKNFSILNATFLNPLGADQDEVKLEAGAPPVQLSTGDYLFVYAAATSTWNPPTAGNYVASYAILDKDTLQVVQRSEVPFLYPTFTYQTGTGSYPYSRKGVIFFCSLTPLGNDTFRFFAGGGDGNVGTGILEVQPSC